MPMPEFESKNSLQPICKHQNVVVPAVETNKTKLIITSCQAQPIPALPCATMENGRLATTGKERPQLGLQDRQSATECVHLRSQLNNEKLRETRSSLAHSLTTLLRKLVNVKHPKHLMQPKNTEICRNISLPEVSKTTTVTCNKGETI